MYYETIHLFTVFKCKLGLPTKFLFFYCCSMIKMIMMQDSYHTKRMRCELCLIVGKVLIFFIVQLNNKSISPTECAQFEDITSIKTLIKNNHSTQSITFKCPRGMT